MCAQETAPRPPGRRSWRSKFQAALRGVGLGVWGHSSFAVHLPVSLAVLALAAVLRCGPLEWCLLLGCVGLVLTAELFNSTVETLFRGLDEATRARAWPCLDIAAGAVLTASFFAAVVGLVIFLPRLLALLRGA